MSMIIDFPNFKFKQDPQGNWIWKSINPLTKKGNLKAEYKDLPRLKAIYQIEEQWTKDFESMVQEGLKEGLKQLL